MNQTLASAHSAGITQMNIIGEKVYYGLPRDNDIDKEAASRILVDNVSLPL